MHFRPGDLPQGDPSEEDSPVEWEDNAISNSMAWASHRLTPEWCQSEDHWTARLTQYLFTDCPCCMLFRGVVVGVVAAHAIWLLLGLYGLTIWLLL